QTWTILRQRLGWTRQRPARRAVERNDEAIERWVSKDWPRIKKRPAPGSCDLLSGRERVLAAASGEGYLGAARPDPGADPPVFLEADVDGRGAGLPARPQPGQFRVPDQARQLQHHVADRVPHRPTGTPGRAARHADLGWPVRAPVGGNE